MNLFQHATTSLDPRQENKGPGYMDILVLPKEDFGIETGDEYAGLSAYKPGWLAYRRRLTGPDKAYIRKAAVSADSST